MERRWGTKEEREGESGGGGEGGRERTEIQVYDFFNTFLYYLIFKYNETIVK